MEAAAVADFGRASVFCFERFETALAGPIADIDFFEAADLDFETERLTPVLRATEVVLSDLNALGLAFPTFADEVRAALASLAFLPLRFAVGSLFWDLVLTVLRFAFLILAAAANGFLGLVN